MNYLTEKELSEKIVLEVIPILQEKQLKDIKQIYFYGAGCSTPSKKTCMAKVLRLISPNAFIIADHDMLGAAISISQGVNMCVCILGTGSNTCIYNGKTIEKNFLSLGYLLGDEGSGTYMGMKFIQQLLKGKVPQDLSEKFYQDYPKTPEDIVSDMYSAPKTAAYFAPYSYFLAKNINHLFVENLVKNCFRDFFREQVLIFEESKSYPIGVIGSIAYIFEKQLREVSEEFQLVINKILKNPIEGLISYYQVYE